MQDAKPLPPHLVERYHGWHEKDYEVKKALFHDLVDNGQHPLGMIISCCDSRVNLTAIFGADAGEFFIHRNIANLVPPFNLKGDHHGTSAALEYAVTALGVAHILVVGHSHCGGVQGCHDMCSGKNEALLEKTSFVGRWIEALRPAYERLAGTDKADDIHALEHEGVLLSLENLTTFPFVQEAIAGGKLSLHGLWHDIRNGELHHYNAGTQAFERV